MVRLYERTYRLFHARTANITARSAKGYYFVAGPARINTQGPHSTPIWYGVIAGADRIVKNLQLNGQGPMAWRDRRLDPDFHLVRRQYSPELVLNDSKAGIRAVKNHRVIPLSRRMFYWDGSMEGTSLLTQFIAKALYPDRFADLDMEAESGAF